MNAYLFTWNPEQWRWKKLSEELEKVKNGLVCQERWSCSHSKLIRKGDRAFLMRLGVSPKGIMASGVATSNWFEAPHFDPVEAKKGKTCNYVPIDWSVLLEPVFGRLLTLKELQKPPFPKMNWTPEASGNTIPEDVAEVLERAWREHLGVLNIKPIVKPKLQ
jgi:5-methylcytosine-specific restriction protein A